MRATCCLLIIVAAFSLLLSDASAAYMNVTFTGDNIIGAWYQNGGDPVPQPEPDPNNYENWRKADTAVLDVDWGHYQLIFMVQNLEDPPGSGNPAGFLAEVTGPGVSGDLLTGVTWDWADAAGGVPSDFGNLTWASATSYGTNDNNTIWLPANSGAPITGISGDAHWIWNGNNSGGSGTDSPLFFRGEFLVTPEPTMLALLGVGLALMGGLRLRRR